MSISKIKLQPTSLSWRSLYLDNHVKEMWGLGYISKILNVHRYKINIQYCAYQHDLLDNQVNLKKNCWTDHKGYHFKFPRIILTFLEKRKEFVKRSLQVVILIVFVKDNLKTCTDWECKHLPLLKDVLNQIFPYRLSWSHTETTKPTRNC